VAGKGIQRMKEAGIKVETGILEQEGGWLNRSFFTWIKENRPFIILKWAQSADGFIGRPQQRLAISGPLTQRLVHRWRAASDAIMVGATTALVDNPRLDNRFYPGKSTTRIVLDAQSRLPDHFHLLDDSQETWIIGRTKPFNGKQTRCIPSKAPMSISWLLEELRLHNKAILLVEGGANLLNQFIQLHFWDEIRVIENQQKLQDGIPAPTLPDTVFLQESYFLDKDAVRIFASKHSFV
jgi:diaminohydroxyphosphoribosylaminopyrimidine deaminase/5-amino-6-(5-phosphoribosylamino)uracil reductase